MAGGQEIANELETLLERFMALHEKLYFARGVCEKREPDGGDVLYEMTSLATDVNNDFALMIALAARPETAAALASAAEKVEAVLAARG